MSKVPNINWNLQKEELPARAQETLRKYIKNELEKKINNLPDNYKDAAIDIINYDIKHDNYKLIYDLLFKQDLNE